MPFVTRLDEGARIISPCEPVPETDLRFLPTYSQLILRRQDGSERD